MTNRLTTNELRPMAASRRSSLVMRRSLLSTHLAQALVLLVLIATAWSSTSADISSANPSLPGTWTTIANGDDIRKLTREGNTVWAATRGGGAVQWDLTTGTYTQTLFPQTGIAANDVRDIAIDATGNRWFATSRGLSRQAPDDTWTTFTLTNTLSHGASVAQLTADAAAGATQLQVSFSSAGEAETKLPEGLLFLGDDPTLYYFEGATSGFNQPTVMQITPPLAAALANGTSISKVILGLPSDDVTAVEVAPDGALWVGTRQVVRQSHRYLNSDRFFYGGGVARFDGTTWTTYLLASGLSSATITDIGIEADGSKVWLATDTYFQWIPSSNPDDPPGTGKWSPTAGGGVSMFDGTRWTIYQRSPDNPASYPSHNSVRAVAIDTANRKWFATWGGGINVFDSSRNRWTVFTKPIQEGAPGPAGDYISSIGVDSQGQVWAGVSESASGGGLGVNVFDHNDTLTDTSDDTWALFSASPQTLAADIVSAILTDSPAGSNGRSPILFGSHTTAGNGGGLSALDDGDTVFEPSDDQWGTYTTRQTGLVSNQVTALAVAPDGSLWIGTGHTKETRHGLGISVRQPDGTWRHYDATETQSRGDAVTTILEDAPADPHQTYVLANFTDSNQAKTALASGYVMFGSDPTVYKFYNFYTTSKRLTITPGLVQPVHANDPVYAVIIDTGTGSNNISGLAFGVDATGENWELWAGTRWDTYDALNKQYLDGGVSQLSSGLWRTFKTSDTGLSSPLGDYDNVSAVAAEPAVCGRKVWVGTGSLRDYSGSGLARFDPAAPGWQAYTTSNQLVSNNVTALAVDPQSCAVWMVGAPYTVNGTRTGGGLSRFDPTAGTWQRWCNASGSSSCRSSLEAYDNDVRAVAVDASGQVWVGAYRYTGTALPLDQPYTDAVVNTFDRGSNTWSYRSFARDGWVSALAVLPNGQVWVGTSRGDGDSFGLDVAEGGVWLYDGTDWTRLTPVSSGLAGKSITSIAVSPEGQVYVGLLDGGISVYDPVPPTPTPTATDTSTETPTPTDTPTATATATSTETPTDTPTVTLTISVTATPSDTATPSPTSSLTATATATATSSPSTTPADTASPSPTPTPTGSTTATATQTGSPTATASTIATSTPTVTPSHTATPTPPTATVTPSRTATPTASVTLTPTETPTPVLPRIHRVFLPAIMVPPPKRITPTWTSRPSVTPAVSYTPTASPTGTATPTGTVSPTSSVTASPTQTPSPTATGTASPTGSPTTTASPTWTFTPSLTPTATWTATATHTPSVTPTATASATLSPSPTASASPTPTASTTATATETPTETVTPTATATATASPTQTATASATPTPTPFLNWVPVSLFDRNPPDLRGLYFVSPTAGWAVGTQGTILYYNGTDWIDQSVLISSTLNAVSMISRTAGWLVGDDGVILRYRNGAWQTYEIPPNLSDSYSAIFMRSADEGYIVGRNHTFLYFQSGTWNADWNAPENTFDLSAMSFGPGGTGWAVGENGDVVQFAGSWSRRQGVDSSLYGIHMLTDTYGWAAGRNGMYYINGQCESGTIECWHPDISRSYTGLTMRGVYLLSTTDGWEVGDGSAILHWNGQTWTTVVEPNPLNPTLRRVVMVNPWEGWAIGDRGTILHYGGPQYAPPPTPTPTRTPSVTPTPTATLSPTATSSPTVTVTATTTATPTVTSTNGAASSQTPTPTATVHGVWTVQTVGSADLRALSFLDTGKGWAVGAGGAIWYYNGSQWVDQSGATENQLNSVAMGSSTQGWAVGDGGIVLHYLNGRWSPDRDTLVPTDDYTVVRMVSSQQGWMFGANGTLLRLVDDEWQQDFTAPENATNVQGAVLSADGQYGWAAGNNGLLLEYKSQGWGRLGQVVFNDHYGISVIPDPSSQLTPWYGWIVGQYQGGGVSGMLYFPSDECGARPVPCWHTYDFPPEGTLYSVALLADNDGWAVGEGGLIAHWDGTAWTQINPLTTSTLRAVQFLSPTSGWAVGDGGTILEYAAASSGQEIRRSGRGR